MSPVADVSQSSLADLLRLDGRRARRPSQTSTGRQREPLRRASARLRSRHTPMSRTRVPCADGPGVAHYVASKFGVRGPTQSLAVELGAHGIRVLAIAPTVTLTPGLEE